MKIAILSDFHLGYERFREDAFNQAEEALNKAADMADMIIIPGDIFDNRTPKPDVIAEAINLFRNLSARKWKSEVTGFVGEGKSYTRMPIIAIPGTHERRAQEVADPVDILGLAGLVVDVSNATAIVESEGERVAVRGIGGIADDRFREIVGRENPMPTEGAFNIFMFHESIYELLPFNQDFMRMDELPKGFDLYVSGHIHNKVEMEVHGKKFLIPGSTVLTQLKAGEQEAKGFFLFDTKTEKYEFVKINSRRFVMLKLDIGKMGDLNPVDFIQNYIDSMIKSSNGVPVIRIVLEGKAASARSSEMEINDIPRRYAGKAIVEISKGTISGESVKEAVASDSVIFEHMSVRDYGIGIFLEKVKASGIKTGDVSPVELLDLLGADGPRDKVVKAALDKLVS